ncbi:MAG: PP2C family protein-serine/threonine phosphatase [Minicystis sp.]
MPRTLAAAGLDVAVGFEPCKWVGGDYVDVVQLADGRVLFAVADVCGKGLQAALVSSSLHTIVRAAADNSPRLADLMERVNKHLCDWLPAHSFVTMVAAIIEPTTGRLECVNAGHPPVFIVDRRGELRLLQEAENPALGIAPCAMATQSARLELGDVLAMYTDGLTELRDEAKEMLGQDRLGQELARICGTFRAQGMEAVREGLMTALDAFRGDEPPEDDRTFLLARRA